MKFLAAALALTLASPATALDLASMTDAERAAFRAEVRAYLLDNPEVLTEAISVLEKRQQTAEAANDLTLVATNADDIFKDANSWVGGNPDGNITIVEFTDYRCGYCRKAYDEVEELVKSDGNIRFVVKEFPILGEQSVLSSRFAIAVRQLNGDDAYKRAHDALISLRGDATPETLTRLAADLGFDAAAVMAKMDAPEVTAVIDANHGLGDRLQISGTPTFVIDQTLVRGYVPLEGMRSIVEDQRKG
ncbi:DsbA family protein [Rhodobacter ferrooxidans]|uniref:DSBA oxidoreductase n=1 Tax=Rhodobacter ferrooxidans TaxID=371731 RepID=C8RZH4_9RHOB|nr:DsbA family protein [Rhodobacter sp. SW2]EEW25771.1 DSBA oxidoreductase [Rhodobacter sp. SW2]